MFFSWECALKMTKIELESPTDVDTILDYENGIRGGITRVMWHYVKIINICMIMMKLKKVHAFNILILTINTDGLYRNHFLDINVYAWFYFQLHKNSDYPLIVDVDYPEYMQSLHKDFLFSPEKIVNNEI